MTRRFFWLSMLAAGCALSMVGSAGAQTAPERTSRPCFVPAHPQKQIRGPRIEAATSPRAHAAIPEQTPFAYRDGHLQMQGAAALPTPVVWNVLGILVDFEDHEMGTRFAADVPDSIRMYFDRVMTNLNEMYDTMSGGQLSITWSLTPQIYRLPETMAYYGLDDSIATREAQLCQDAVQAADPDVDFTQYDVYMTFHAGPGQEADIFDDSRELIWSVFFRQIDFQFWLDAPDAEFGIRTQDTAPGGGTHYVDHMVVCPEVESQDGFDFGMQGVVAHEFGHRFGLPDLYDTTADDDDFIFADSQGIGTFGLMGAGIWNDNGFFPAEMSAWSRFFVGWLRPPVVTDEQSIDLRAIVHDRNFGAVRIPLGGDEYFLVENRIRDYNGNGEFDFDDANGDGDFDIWTDSYAGAEYDWYLPQIEDSRSDPNFRGSGLLIWHIDESVIRELLRYNLVNADALHKGIDLEEADGIQDLDKLEFQLEAFGDPRDSWWAPNATEFTPESLPSTDGYNDALSQVWLTDISIPGDTMSFSVRFTSPEGNRIGDFRSGWPRSFDGLLAGDFNPLAVDLNGDDRPEIAVCLTDASGMGGVYLLDADGNGFPGGGAPAPLTHGRLRAEPIAAELGWSPPGPELVWVSGDTVYAWNATAGFLSDGAGSSPTPVPWFVLPSDPERIRISAGDLLPGSGDQVLVPEMQGEFASAIHVLEYAGGLTVDRLAMNVPGRLMTPVTILDGIGLNGSGSGAHREIAAGVTTETGGFLAVIVPDEDAGQTVISEFLTYSVGDTVAFGVPVAGDLNRDGLDEIAVTDSEGRLHLIAVNGRVVDGSLRSGIQGAAANNDRFNELQGWPRDIGALATDEVSLADVDGDGYLEAMAFGPNNLLYLLNYNGTTNLSLPYRVPGEDRFTEPFLAPLVMDVTGSPDPELLLPLPDGQVRAHDSRGRVIPDWSYLGGGNQGTYPIVVDLDGNGSDLELVTVEDITVNIPEDIPIDEGDESPGLERRARVVVRGVGPGTGDGPWPAYRGGGDRSGRALTPSAGPGEPGGGGLLAESFVMPNPVRDEAGFHYRIRSDVQRMTIEIFDATGRTVRRITGTVFPGTDNLVPWDLASESGTTLAPGLYLARFQAEAGTSVEVQTRTFVVLR